MVASVLDQEIREQPDVLTRLMDVGLWSVIGAAERIREFEPHFVVVAARGTSDNAARYAKYLFGAHNGLSVSLAEPSLYTMYGKPPRIGKALVIGISQSGQSPDVVGVVAEARRQGALTLSITNDASSPLAYAGELCVPLSAGDERSVAATKTYTAELLAIAMLSAALSPNPALLAAAQFVPRAVRDALDMCERGLANVNQVRDAMRFLVVGRGFNYCTAFELALKMKETSYVLAEPYSIADLMHGPVALVERNFPVIVIAPSGSVSDSVAEVLPVLARRKARAVVVSDRSELLKPAHIALPLPSGVPEWLSPIVASVPCQLFAQALAHAKGHDPDMPRGLAKVTLTH